MRRGHRVSWFRSNRGRVTWLALFALACQLVLTFGHIHLGKVSVAPIAVAANAGLVVSADEDSAALTRAPPLNYSTAGDDSCALCASINLAASLVVPTAPTVVLPFSSDVALKWSQAGREHVAFDHIFFDARGPPHA
jgi:hypothetical protein